MRVISMAALVVVAIGGAATACSIPVFRYALERWRPDPYEVLVYHRGELSEDQTAWLQRLSPEYVPGEPLPNAAVSSIDLDSDVRPEFAAIWEAEQGEPLPWVLLRTPWRGENETIWSGPLNAESIETILQSPRRAEIVRRLAEGDSIVWVLLDGADAAENERLEMDCTTQLQGFQRAIALPAIEQEDLKDLSVDPDSLGLRFSMLRLGPDDPAESILLSSLLAVQPGLAAQRDAGRPMLFPVFGRARVYYPLVGADIEPQQLEDLARFLSGACQCTIKQQNPGLDLLTAIDWDAYVLGIETEKPLPPLTGLAGFGGAGETALLPAEVSRPAVEPQAGEAAKSVDEESGGQAPSTASDDSAEVSMDTTRPTTAVMVASAPPVPDDSVTSLVFWIGGLLTGVVAVVSLWVALRTRT